MLLLGLALLLLGVVLVIAEAHVPGGALGGAGAFALAGGVVVVVLAAGASLAVGGALALALGAASAGWAVLAAGTVARVRRTRARSGAEALPGQTGVVRRWSEPGGQVFVDGALWRARHDDTEGEGSLNEGDPVVVEYVRGLTLSVRRAEEWELTA
ncbi:MAG TPA: NfeD family protein [Baekduia sp.]|nr:NfeD family protein [Baekduia sp.]